MTANHTSPSNLTDWLANQGAASSSLSAAGFDPVAVVGAGLMGRGIAQVFATHGFRVLLQDLAEPALTHAHGAIMASLTKLASKNQLPAGTNPTAIGQRIYLTTNLLDIKTAGCRLIIEAIVENLLAKKELYQQLTAACPDAIIATNTSALSLAVLAASGGMAANQFIGIHFMNPPPLMPLVEIITTDQTDKGLTAAVKTMLEQDLKKSPILAKDSPGFILNRLLLPYINEAVMLLEQGVASREDIDRAMELGAGYKMGPLQLADFIGLDTCHAILETLAEATGQGHYRPAALLTHLVGQKNLGRKTNKGFYDYPTSK